MKFKKIAKLFVLFTLMNLVGSVVWADDPKTTTGESQPTCQADRGTGTAKGNTDTSDNTTKVDAAGSTVVQPK